MRIEFLCLDVQWVVPPWQPCIAGQGRRDTQVVATVFALKVLSLFRRVSVVHSISAAGTDMEEISLTDFDQLNWVEHVGDYGSGCGYCHGPQKSINMVLNCVPCFDPSTLWKGHHLQRRLEDTMGLHPCGAKRATHAVHAGHVGAQPHRGSVPGAAGQGLEALWQVAVPAPAGEAGLRVLPLHHPPGRPQVPPQQGVRPRSSMAQCCNPTCCATAAIPLRAAMSEALYCAIDHVSKSINMFVPRHMQAQRRVLRIFEAYLAGAPLSAASDGAHPAMDLEPPQTPPLHAEHHAAIGPIVAAAAAGLQAFKKRRHSREQAQQSSSAYPTGEPSPDKGARPVSAKGGSPANAARPHAGSAKAQPAQQVRAVVSWWLCPMPVYCSGHLLLYCVK